MMLITMMIGMTLTGNQKFLDQDITSSATDTSVSYLG